MTLHPHLFNCWHSLAPPQFPLPQAQPAAPLAARGGSHGATFVSHSSGVLSLIIQCPGPHKSPFSVLCVVFPLASSGQVEPTLLLGIR